MRRILRSRVSCRKASPDRIDAFLLLSHPSPQAEDHVKRATFPVPVAWKRPQVTRGAGELVSCCFSVRLILRLPALTGLKTQRNVLENVGSYDVAVEEIVLEGLIVLSRV